VTDGSVLVQCNDAKVWGPKEMMYVSTHHLDLIGGGLATPRWSPSTLVFVVVALAILIWNCGDMCLLLLDRIELPQLTEASGECPEELIPDSTKPCARYIRLLELPFFLVELLRLVFLERRKMFNPQLQIGIVGPGSVPRRLGYATGRALLVGIR